nr:hypothetical protein [Tanacetum cinerariifolium]
MQQKIKRLQAQSGDLKGKCKDTSCVSDTQNQVFQKLENVNMELEFQVFNYAKENAHLKLFKKVSDEKENTQDSSKNTKFSKQPIAEILPKIGETKALSKPVTSNSVSKPPVSKGVNNAKVIAPGMFRISPEKVSREAKKVPNTVSASTRTKPITVSQPPIITKKNVNSDLNGLSSTGKHKANVSKNETQKEYRQMVSKSKNIGTHKSLATPEPRKPRFLLKWSPTGKMFDPAGKVVAPSGYPDLFVVHRLRLFQAHDGKFKASHQFLLEVYGNCPLRE